MKSVGIKHLGRSDYASGNRDRELLKDAGALFLKTVSIVKLKTISGLTPCYRIEPKTVQIKTG